MSYLLDVNFLLACGWHTHARHAEANIWLDRQPEFATCAFSEAGFIRVSMTYAYGASFTNAVAVLSSIKSKSAARFVSIDIQANTVPLITSHSDVTDAYLIEVARANRTQLATLDDALCKKAWAKGIAVNPL